MAQSIRRVCRNLFSGNGLWSGLAAGSIYARHHDILREALAGVREKRVVELAAESGSAVGFLNKDLSRVFREGGLELESLPAQNGALLYFRACKG